MNNYEKRSVIISLVLNFTSILIGIAVASIGLLALYFLAIRPALIAELNNAYNKPVAAASKPFPIPVLPTGMTVPDGEVYKMNSGVFQSHCRGDIVLLSFYDKGKEVAEERLKCFLSSTYGAGNPGSINIIHTAETKDFINRVDYSFEHLLEQGKPLQVQSQVSKKVWMVTYEKLQASGEYCIIVTEIPPNEPVAPPSEEKK